LTNGDGFTFEYATVDLTPDYAAWLLRLVAEAEKLKEAHDGFYSVELFDSAVEYGSVLGVTPGALDDETSELIDSDGEWVQVPDNHRWPDGCLQSVSAATVVVTADSIHWRAAAKHGDDGTYFETPALTVARLREMFPSQVAEHGVEPTAGECVLSFPVCYDRDVTDPEALGYAFDRLLDTAMSTPGILDEYGNPTIGATFLGQDATHEPAQESTQEALPHARRYVEMGGGFCPKCQSHQTEGDSVDFGGDYCTQRMYCLDCEAVWFDVYTLTSVEPRD